MGTSVSRAAMAHVRAFAASIAAFLLALGLAPMAAFADDSVAASFVLAASEGSAEGATPNSAASIEGEGITLASTLAGASASVVSADVALDAADPIVGSFTVDGLTYALNDGKATLISVSSDLQQVTGSQDADGSRVAPMLASGQVAIPSSAAYNGVTYDVVAVGSYAFYLSGASSVELPDSIASADSRAFRSSDVARVEVDPANPNIASYEGALYSADLTSLLLIPEGRAGSVPIPSEAEVVEASKFSHCSLVDVISVDGGGAAFASWDGLLYDASGQTLLRVPPGATDITIRDGCTAIAAGALEGCAKLERINAPATVISISPDVFESVPTVSLPIASALQDDTQDDSVAGPLAGPGYEGDARSASAGSPAEGEPADSAQAEGEAEASPRRVVASSQGLEAPLALPDLGSTSASPSSEAVGSGGTQITAIVALSTTDDGLPEVDPSSIEVALPDGADAAVWEDAGFPAVAGLEGEEDEETSDEAAPVAQILSYEAASALSGTGSVTVVGPHWRNGGGISALPTTRVSSSATYSGTFGACGGVYVWPTGVTSATFYVHVSSTNNTYCVSDAANKVGYPIFYCYDCDRIIDCRYKAINPNHTHNDYESGTHGSFSFDWSTYYCWIPNGGKWDGLDGEQATKAKRTPTSNIRGSMTVSGTPDGSLPTRAGYKLVGWNTEADGSGQGYGVGATVNSSIPLNLYAQWERMDYDIGFDTSSEPSDADYPGDAKPDESANIDSGQVEIEDPKRPGYVFEGWVIPTEDGTKAVDQELVYQGDDGKWYVDASKLPDYAGDDGRVELTARWTSVISVDVPSSVTFYADLVTQGQESREGAADGAFGQNQVSNQSQVDLRVVGLESSAVKTEGSTLGADSILKKADAATPSTSTQKLLSLYPSTKQWRPEDLQNPDAVGGDKDAAAVDFDLDDILLEKSFSADDFTIAAGGTLNMGYRLNLAETGQQLDYDKLATLSEGQSASIANVSYCFAADALPSDWDEPLWVENPDRTSNPAKYLLLKDIKQAADDLSANGTSSAYYATYKGLLDAQVTDNGNPGVGPYFQLKVDGVYLPLQLIGICQDTKSDGTGNAGLTFQMRDVYAASNTRCSAAGGGTFNAQMNPAGTNSGGWQSSAMRSTLRSTFWGYLPAETQAAIVEVDKFQQLYIGFTFDSSPSYLQKTMGETIWIPSMFEVFGTTFEYYNESEALTSVSGYAPFQYMAYAPGGTGTINTKAIKRYNGSVNPWWFRSAHRVTTYDFGNVNATGTRSPTNATYLPNGTAPCFCL